MFLRKKDRFVSLVLRHLGTSALMDLLLRLVSCVEPAGLRQEVLHVSVALSTPSPSPLQWVCGGCQHRRPAAMEGLRGPPLPPPMWFFHWGHEVLVRAGSPDVRPLLRKEQK